MIVTQCRESEEAHTVMARYPEAVALLKQRAQWRE
jgi:hypothetical protein